VKQANSHRPLSKQEQQLRNTVNPFKERLADEGNVAGLQVPPAGRRQAHSRAVKVYQAEVSYHMEVGAAGFAAPNPLKRRNDLVEYRASVSGLVHHVKDGVQTGQVLARAAW